MANALATHMKANMVTPISALMLSSLTELMVFLKMTNMTVAMTEAAVMTRALKKARIATGKVSQRVNTDRGMRKMRTKERQVPVRKRPNIHCDASLIRSRMSLMSAGRLRGTRKQLVPYDFNRIEPIQCLRIRARCHSLVLVTFAVSP